MDNFYEKHNGGFNSFEVRNLEFPLAADEFFKIIFVSEGVLQVSTALESFELFEGDCRIFFPGEVHAAYTYDKSVCKIVTFGTDCCEDFFAAVFGKIQQNGIFKLEGDIDYLESISAEEDYYMNKSNLYAILASYTKKVSLIKNTNKNSEFIAFVSNFVRKNCTQEITLKDLAENLGYGYNYTSSLFKKSFKCNFLFFVNQHRLAEAEKMLHSRPDLSITDIAFECGFNSLRSFDRNFQAQKGVSPKEFRGS